jgi:hypothetical protein
MRLSLPSAKKPMDRPSGDQNGSDGFSVPDSGRATGESRSRSHRKFRPEGPRATRASCVPSGDKARARTVDIPGRRIALRTEPENPGVA